METLKDFAQIVGIAIAVISLLITAYNTLRTKRVRTAEFWLELRERFKEFDEIHEALRPAGIYGVEPENDEPQGCPSCISEWRRLESYMGFLEHCSIMLQQHLIDWRTFNSIYGYRVRNICNNPYIVQAKLINKAKFWQDFLWLTRKMRINIEGTSEDEKEWPKCSLSGSFSA